MLEPTLLRSFLGQTSQGRGLLIQAGLVVVVAGLARSARTTRGAAVAMLVALAALAPPTLTGHSASAGSHELAVASLLVHLLAAGLWVGGLAALAWAALAGTDGPALCRPAVLDAGRMVLRGRRRQRRRQRRGAARRAARRSSRRRTAPWCWPRWRPSCVLGGFGWWHRQHTVAAQVTKGGTGSRAARGGPAVPDGGRRRARRHGVDGGPRRRPVPHADARRRRRTDICGRRAARLPAAGQADLEPSLAFGWAPDGFALAFLVLAVALYAAGVLALRRRGDRWPVGRTVCWAAGLLVFAWATVGGLGLYSHVLFSAHMVAHMLLSMVAPIGLVLGAPVTLALRALPGPRVPGELGPRQLLLAVLHSRVARVVMHPLVAFALFVGSLYAIYFTSLFPTLMSNHLGHVVMELHFLAVGFLFFFVLVGVDPAPVRLPSIARIGLLFAAMPFHAFFSVAIMGGDTVLAPTATSVRSTGPTRPTCSATNTSAAASGGRWASCRCCSCSAPSSCNGSAATRARPRASTATRTGPADERSPLTLRSTTNSADTTPIWPRSPSAMRRRTVIDQVTRTTTKGPPDEQPDSRQG